MFIRLLKQVIRETRGGGRVMRLTCLVLRCMAFPILALLSSPQYSSPPAPPPPSSSISISSHVLVPC